MIEGVKTWRYVMEVIVPPGITDPQMVAMIAASVSWVDSMLPLLRGSTKHVFQAAPPNLTVS